MGKKILAVLSAFCMAVPCAFAFTGCSDNSDEASTVMTVSLNPQVEFILDANDNVLSVSALNDEGNFIVANASFTGKSAEEAVNLFLSVSEENGFVASAKSGDSTAVEISISGDDAQALYDSVSSKVSETYSSIKLSLETIDTDYIKDQLEDCAVQASELADKTEAELLALLEDCRKEATKLNLNTQELKEAYFNEKYFAEKKATIEAYIDQLSSELPVAIQTAFTAAKNTFDVYYTSLQTTFKQYIDSAYTEVMTAYAEAKKAVLEAAKENDGKVSAELEAALETAEAAYEAVKTSAQTAINSVMSSIKTSLELCETTLGSYLSSIDTSKVETAVNSALDSFNTEFSASYSATINSNIWGTLSISGSVNS